MCTWAEAAENVHSILHSWRKRYKVAQYGRSRCLALHRQEVEEDPPVEAQSPRVHGEEAVVPLPFEPAMPQGKSSGFIAVCTPNVHDRTDTTGPPTSAELDALAEARNERSESGAGR